MSERMESAFALAQHNAYTVMRNDPGIWNDSLRRALEAVLPMVWAEAQAEAREGAEAERAEWENEVIEIIGVEDDDDVAQSETIIRHLRTLFGFAITEYAIEFPGGTAFVSEDRGDVEDWAQWIIAGELVQRTVLHTEWRGVES